MKEEGIFYKVFITPILRLFMSTSECARTRPYFRLNDHIFLVLCEGLYIKVRPKPQILILQISLCCYNKYHDWLDKRHRKCWWWLPYEKLFWKGKEIGTQRLRSILWMKIFLFLVWMKLIHFVKFCIFPLFGCRFLR